MGHPDDGVPWTSRHVVGEDSPVTAPVIYCELIVTVVEPT